jgi:hypothetical protein
MMSMVSTESLQYLQCLQEFPEFADEFSGGHVATPEFERVYKNSDMTCEAVAL